jgi:hypothetical protein
VILMQAVDYGVGYTGGQVRASFGRATFCMITVAKGNHRMSRHLFYLGVLTLVFLAEAGGPSGQGAETNALAKIKSLKCVFPVYASGSWKSGEPQAVAKTGQLSIQIDAIDVQDGSARFVGAGESSHIITRGTITCRCRCPGSSPSRRCRSTTESVKSDCNTQGPGSAPVGG